MHFYITGDTHGDFRRIEQFCLENDTTVEDVMIILGDAGINYHLDSRDNELKEELSQLDITLFCIHGNHEARPWEAGDYDEIEVLKQALVSIKSDGVRDAEVDLPEMAKIFTEMMLMDKESEKLVQIRKILVDWRNSR